MKVVHMQNEHGIGGLQTGHQMLCRCDSCTNCPICGAVSSSQHGLKIHLAQRHGLVCILWGALCKIFFRKWSETLTRLQHDMSSSDWKKVFTPFSFKNPCYYSIDLFIFVNILSLAF